MHAALSAVLLVTAAQTTCPNTQHVVTVAAEGCCSRARGPCGGRTRCCGWAVARGSLAACCGYLPRACCAPWLGCCPGSPCHTCRYSASRGYYYSQAHDYRHVFDYPWHATAHRPQYLFTYQGAQPGSREQIPTPDPDRESVLFQPLPLAPSPP